MTITEQAVAYFGARRVKLYTVRRNDILASLQTVSNANAQRALSIDLNATRGQRSNESTLPPGLLWKLQDWGDNKPPPKWRSLFDHYLWRFEREVGANLWYGELLCSEAEIDYVDATSRPFALEDPSDRDRRILSAYRGKHPLRAAAYERGVDEWHIVKLRRENHLDPMTGLDPERDDPADFDLDPLLDASMRRGATAVAEDFLRAELAGGPIAANVLFRKAQMRGISQTALRSAKKAMRVESYKRGNPASGQSYYWMIPRKRDQPPPGDTAEQLILSATG